MGGHNFGSRNRGKSGGSRARGLGMPDIIDHEGMLVRLIENADHIVEDPVMRRRLIEHWKDMLKDIRTTAAAEEGRIQSGRIATMEIYYESYRKAMLDEYGKHFSESELKKVYEKSYQEALKSEAPNALRVMNFDLLGDIIIRQLEHMVRRREIEAIRQITRERDRYRQQQQREAAERRRQQGSGSSHREAAQERERAAAQRRRLQAITLMMGARAMMVMIAMRGRSRRAFKGGSRLRVRVRVVRDPAARLCGALTDHLTQAL